jgi:hypothetical protein
MSGVASPNARLSANTTRGFHRRSHATAKIGGFLLFMLLVAAPAASQQSSPPPDNADVLTAIGACASKGMETALLKAQTVCTFFSGGPKQLPSEMPLQADAQQACDAHKSGTTDKRILPGHAIKTIVLDPSNHI